MIIVPKPRSDKKGESQIAPLSVTASPEYFDTEEFMKQFEPVLNVTTERITNINLYTDAIEKAEKKKKEEAEKKKSPTSTTTAKKDKPAPGTTITKTSTKQVPNPDYIAPEDRNEDNEDYDPETYDEDEPEFLTEEVREEVPIQKPLI